MPDQAAPRPITRHADRNRDGKAPIEAVARAIGDLRFGTIQLTVHEGRLVQVDVTERHRYPN